MQDFCNSSAVFSSVCTEWSFAHASARVATFFMNRISFTPFWHLFCWFLLLDRIIIPFLSLESSFLYLEDSCMVHYVFLRVTNLCNWRSESNRLTEAVKRTVHVTSCYLYVLMRLCVLLTLTLYHDKLNAIMCTLILIMCVSVSQWYCLSQCSWPAPYRPPACCEKPTNGGVTFGAAAFRVAV